MPEGRDIWPLRLLKTYRNTGDWQDPQDEFNAMFHCFSDDRGIRNMGGIRVRRTEPGGPAAFVLLVTNFGEAEWPDHIDLGSACLTYYGDNRNANDDLHDTPAKGNAVLRESYLAAGRGDRGSVPPFLVFQTLKPDSGSCMRFLGLAAPGRSHHLVLDDLSAVWRFSRDRHYMNYKARLTVLDCNQVDWKWIEGIVSGTSPIDAAGCPEAWREWVEKSEYRPLGYAAHILQSGQ